ncbi:hypothetical protein ASZ90_018048 [hydrocarbon metagenome]|uniref:Uncharacterized protein n=1 Tax=hydrocarbon metagenome TaxID=938273 RepID=A0A0W8E7I2_9ZZZZ
MSPGLFVENGRFVAGYKSIITLRYCFLQYGTENTIIP